ncbi:hypothetical protein FACS1894184_17830 [Clostridia bacterium]|nr:hypothetical protein FACS1894184_17830 [Clostridia bacterium]
MATMYVYNIPSNETVNLRSSPSSSATILVRVSYGKQVDAAPSSTSGWHNALYQGTSGYIMSQYLTTTNPNGGTGGGSTGGQAGMIQGTNVNVRPTPATTGAAKCQVNTGNTVTYYPDETYSGNGYSWYRCTSSLWSGDGYIVTTYVQPVSGGGTGGGTGGGSSGNSAIYDQILTFSNGKTGDSSVITWATYKANLERYASDPLNGYQSGGATQNSANASGYSSMCCAYFPYISRTQKGYAGCTTQYGSGEYIKGTIASIGGLDALIPGMEIFKGTDETKEHMGVYAGRYDFGDGNGLQHSVFQSLSAKPTITKLRFNKQTADQKGPNQTTIATGWVYWAWSKNVRL